MIDDLEKAKLLLTQQAAQYAGTEKSPTAIPMPGGGSLELMQTYALGIPLP